MVPGPNSWGRLPGWSQSLRSWGTGPLNPQGGYAYDWTITSWCTGTYDCVRRVLMKPSISTDRRNGTAYAYSHRRYYKTRQFRRVGIVGVNLLLHCGLCVCLERWCIVAKRLNGPNWLMVGQLPQTTDTLYDTTR